MLHRLLLGLMLLVTTSIGSGAAAAAPDDGRGAAAGVPGRLIVGLRSGIGFDDADRPVPRLATSRLFTTQAETVHPLGGAAYRLDLAAGAEVTAVARRLLGDPRVRYVEPDYLLTLMATPDLTGLALAPNDPAWPVQAEMRRIEMPQAWGVTTGSPDVVIAVLDTGVMTSHADLAGRLLPGRNFVDDKEDAEDDQGHGTFTAALAAGAGNNRAGIAGMCWQCRILPLKILDNEGRGPSSAFSRAIRYAVDNGARVINVSAGGPNESEHMREAVAYAASKNVLVVAAAGNTPDTVPNYPAAYDSVLAVAASGPDDQVTSFSTRGAFVDLAAPGINITSAARSDKNGIARANGTSASAPLVSGAAALLLSLRPEISVEAVTALLQDTAVDIGAPGRDDHFGVGRVAVYDAVLATARPGPTGSATVQVTLDRAVGLRLTASGFAAGERLRAWLAGSNGQTIVRRGLAANAAGSLTATMPLTGLSGGSAYNLTLFGEQSHRVAVAPVTDGRAEARAMFQPLPPTAAGSDRLYFPETGHTLSGGFRTYWEANGGVAVFGFPISEEFREVNQSDGQEYTVQYFERNRFEYHPEHKGTPYEVQLGLLGAILTADRAFPPAESVSSSSTLRYFPETRHTLSGDFLAYWQANGGLPIFGYPISEPHIEQGRLVQYFERNRFELHPEQPPTHRILLGRLGVDLARRGGYLPDR